MSPFFLIFEVKRTNLLKGLVTFGQANLTFVPITFCSLDEKLKFLKIRRDLVLNFPNLQEF